MSIVQTQTTSFKTELYQAVHNLSTNTLKIALYTGNANLNEDTTVYTTSNEVVASGYTAGGNAATTSSAAQSAGTFKLVLNSPAVWTATGAGFTFRYALLVDSTTNTTVGSWDYGSSQVVAVGETVTVTLDGTNGVFTAA